MMRYSGTSARCHAPRGLVREILLPVSGSPASAPCSISGRRNRGHCAGCQTAFRPSHRSSRATRSLTRAAVACPRPSGGARSGPGCRPGQRPEYPPDHLGLLLDHDHLAAPCRVWPVSIGAPARRQALSNAPLEAAADLLRALSSRNICPTRPRSPTVTVDATPSCTATMSIPRRSGACGSRPGPRCRATAGPVPRPPAPGRRPRAPSPEAPSIHPARIDAPDRAASE